jgi:hypothetical protein
MTSPYRITDTDEPQRPAHRADSRRRLRPLLWVVFAVSVALNVVTTTVNVIAGSAFGIAAVAGAVALITAHRRRSR